MSSPVASPVAFGWKCTFTAVVLAASTVKGSLRLPSTENASLLKVSCETTTGWMVELIRDTTLFPEFPRFTEPNSTVPGEAEKPAELEELVDAELTTMPPQPERRIQETTAARLAIRQSGRNATNLVALTRWNWGAVRANGTELGLSRALTKRE